jgi:hypothetical protein
MRCNQRPHRAAVPSANCLHSANQLFSIERVVPPSGNPICCLPSLTFRPNLRLPLYSLTQCQRYSLSLSLFHPFYLLPLFPNIMHHRGPIKIF